MIVESLRLDLILICRDADAASVSTNALLGMRAAERGRNVGLLFSGAALSAFRNGTFLWPRGFWSQSVRWAAADRARSLGIPVRGNRQWRDIDVAGILEQAISTNVRFLACPVWSQLLEDGPPWPVDLEILDTAQALELLEATRTVVGSL